jgi:hypothetical protein
MEVTFLILAIGLFLVIFVAIRLATRPETPQEERIQLYTCCGLDVQLGRVTGAWSGTMYMCRACHDRYQHMIDS